MDAYLKRVRGNLHPLPENSLAEAYKDWIFTGETKDHGKPIETCQLCEKEKVRYRFKIKNENTNKTLWVGSRCILKFNISVMEQSYRLKPTEVKNKLNSLMQKMRLDACLNTLKALATKQNKDIFNNAIRFYEKNKYFTPKYASAILWHLQKSNIDHSPSLFKINIKKHRQDLREMGEWQIQTIWPALSTAQRSVVITMRHVVPDQKVGT